MRATQAEFRHRFWIITAIFVAGFACFAIEPDTVAAWLSRHLGGGIGMTRVFLGLGAALGFVAAALRTWGSAWLRTEVVKDNRVHAERVVADGPFRHVRNPLYLGVLILGAGMGLVASPLGFLVITLGLSVFLARLIGREEADLSAAQGDTFRAYRAAVPALIPSLRPRLPPSGASPQWGQAFAGELMAWCHALAIALLAITLDVRVFYAMLVLSFFAYLPGRSVRRRAGTAGDNA